MFFLRRIMAIVTMWRPANRREGEGVSLLVSNYTEERRRGFRRTDGQTSNLKGLSVLAPVKRKKSGCGGDWGCKVEPPESCIDSDLDFSLVTAQICLFSSCNLQSCLYAWQISQSVATKSSLRAEQSPCVVWCDGATCTLLFERNLKLSPVIYKKIMTDINLNKKQTVYIRPR